MVENHVDVMLQLPRWLVRVCKWFWGQRVFLWSTIGLNVLLGIVVTLAFTDPTTVMHLPVGFIFQHPFVTLSTFIVLFSCTIVSRLISYLAVPFSERELKRMYLKRLERDTELLTLKGIPAGLISESVHLDTVFIPIQLRFNRPRTDYPLTDKELEYYRQCVKRGMFTSELDRIVIDAEKNWQHILKEGDRISVADLWQRMSKIPVVVIQGYPGMGKSTLMERLTLHMARRHLRQPDPDMLEAEHFEPILIPVLVRLGLYADACAKTPGLTLTQYLLGQALEELHIPGVSLFIARALETASCLTMFDGLDEVSDPNMREYVQKAIHDFIKEKSELVGETCNRFLITSRVAGYDVAAFPDYPHYTIAELTSEQIDYFLLRWCQANVSRDRSFAAEGQDESATREVERRVKELGSAIKDNRSVRELAEIPLLLTLLAVMQQNSIELPRQRVELYRVVTSTLLENRNIAKKLEPIPEAQAIQRLGPLAFQMQETGNSFARHRDVVDSLAHTIGMAGGTPDRIVEEGERFLKRIRERGGLFVQRTGDYYGFMHRMFQEYFAARYMLNQIKLSPDAWIGELVGRARNKDALWREPFLLAVAYQSNENERVASDIIRALLDTPRSAYPEDREHDLLLAAECIIEARPLTIDATLERQVARRLLYIYEISQRNRRFATCDQVEGVMHRWLLSIPKEAYRPPLLAVLLEALHDTAQVTRQLTTLTLLTMIAQSLHACAPIVFEALIPPLLSLSGSRACGAFKPDGELAEAANLDVLDLAFSALSFMGSRGPAGALLAQVRQHFVEHPEHLDQLARCSLACGILLTPTVIPLAEENFVPYSIAIGQWIALRAHYQIQHITGRDIETCLAIHKALLESAEEASYPTALHLLRMLQLMVDHAVQPWYQTWQRYLSDCIDTGSYVTYQEVSFLMAMLFSRGYGLKALIELILRHYDSHDSMRRRYARRFIAALTSGVIYMRDTKYLRYPRDMKDLRYLRDVKNLRYLRDMRNLRYLRDIQNLKHTQNLRYLRDVIYLRKVRYLRNVIYMRYTEEEGDRQDLREIEVLRKLLHTQEVAQKAKGGLPSVDATEYVDLLSILLGRIFQIRETNEAGVEHEVQQIALLARDSFVWSSTDEVRAVALDIVYYVPLRSASEIAFLLHLAEESSEKRIRGACAGAIRLLQYDDAPLTPEVRAALEAGKLSIVETIRDAVESVLERKK